MTPKKPAKAATKSPQIAPESSEYGEIRMTEAAKRLGLTHQGVGQWAAKPGAPVRKDGAGVWVRWPDFIRWREQELVRVAVADATKALRAQLDAASGGTEGGDPIRRKAFADARKSELDVEERERSLVPVDEARAAFAARLTVLRNILVPFPRTAAPKLLGAKTIQEIEQRLEVEMRRTMEALAVPQALEGDSDVGRAA